MENVSSGVGVVLFLKEQYLNLPKEIYSKNVKFSKIKVKVGVGKYVQIIFRRGKTINKEGE